MEADVYVLAAGANSSKVAAQAGHHSHTRYLSLTVCKKDQPVVKFSRFLMVILGAFGHFAVQNVESKNPICV